MPGVAVLLSILREVCFRRLAIELEQVPCESVADLGGALLEVIEHVLLAGERDVALSQLHAVARAVPGLCLGSGTPYRRCIST